MSETSPNLREQIAEAAADWAYAYPIASWSLAHGEEAYRLSRTWGDQAANAVLISGVQRRFDEQAAEIDQLKDTIARVRTLHTRCEGHTRDCDDCLGHNNVCGWCGDPYPCPTIAAIDQPGKPASA